MNFLFIYFSCCFSMFSSHYFLLLFSIQRHVVSAKYDKSFALQRVAAQSSVSYSIFLFILLTAVCFWLFYLGLFLLCFFYFAYYFLCYSLFFLPFLLLFVFFSDSNIRYFMLSMILLLSSFLLLLFSYNFSPYLSIY